VAVVFIITDIERLAYSDPFKFYSYSRAIDAILIVVFSIVHFFDQLGEDSKEARLEFMLTAGFLIYFSLNIIFLLPFNFLINWKSELKFYFWFAFSLSILIFYFYLIALIWINGNRLKRS
jgi:hypothetical protein